MKTYIILGAAGGYISGAPIYHRNKALYMQSLGWNVFYISCCSGTIYVNCLEKFVVTTCSFLCRKAYLFPKKRQKILLDYIIERIPVIGDEVVIETGTYYTAYWGELLARRLKCKHVIIYLDEYNDGITLSHAKFFHFKFMRGELACIAPKTMLEIFEPFWNMTMDEAVGLSCYCSNVLEDYKSELTNKIETGDYNIGYIGRLEKPAVQTIIEGIKEFAKLNIDKKIAFICYGGAEQNVIEDIKWQMKSIPNIIIFISGYLFPMPLDAIRKCNVFFSSAGSVLVSVKAGIPTVKMNAYTNIPDGFIKEIGSTSFYKCPYGNKVVDYLNMFFLEHEGPVMKLYSIENEQKQMEVYLNQHLVFLESSSSKNEYFDISSFRLTWVQRFKKFLIFTLGMRILRFVKE